jgi:hypothetical protein
MAGPVALRVNAVVLEVEASSAARVGSSSFIAMASRLGALIPIDFGYAVD